MLIRTYKKEAELEIWKMKSDGQYALLKTFPMCRWSGQLGPKTREGDRQVPEGFYTIAPDQMNPNSNYYLSFNVGYPNAYDRAWDRTGGNIMVHGVCSSAGCFSMTDAQIAEIYAIAREAFNGGQREIQMQSYPFKMTAENLAKHRLDPNIDFWMQLKNGADHFEVTKTEPSVLVCGKHYVFGAHADGDVSPRAPCPALQRTRTSRPGRGEGSRGQRQGRRARRQGRQGDQARLRGRRPEPGVHGQGRGRQPPRSARGRPAGDRARQRRQIDPGGDEGRQCGRAAEAGQGRRERARRCGGARRRFHHHHHRRRSRAAAPAPAASPSLADNGKNLMKGWFKPAADAPPAVQVYEPVEPVPSDVPLPPRRAASADPSVRVAALPGGAAAKPAAPADADPEAKAQ